MFIKLSFYKIICGLFCLLLAACAGLQPTTTSNTEKKRHSTRGIYKVGEPYQINGIWYYPHEDYNYHEVGIASWYGMDFHGKETANGEVFDMNALSAAHRTLPIPSIVRVTNLVNRHAIMVRINDRGPFVNGRIIDLSHHAAQLLEFDTQGITQVKVEILAEESLALKKQFLQNDILGEDPKIRLIPRLSVVSKSVDALSAHSFSSLSFPSTWPMAPITNSPVTTVTNHVIQIQKVAQSSIIASKSTTYYIQIATFSNPTFASEAFKQFKEIGNVSLLPHLMDGRLLYRLRLGPLTEQALAEKLLTRIHMAGYTDALIIR